MMRTIQVDKGTPSQYAVICPEHGQVFLTANEYRAQMDRPDARWKCTAVLYAPATSEGDAAIVGPCGQVSEFDDDNYETWEAIR